MCFPNRKNTLDSSRTRHMQCRNRDSPRCAGIARRDSWGPIPHPRLSSPFVGIPHIYYMSFIVDMQYRILKI